MKLLNHSLIVILIASILGGAMPADAGTLQQLQAYNNLVREINDHEDRLCATFPETNTCNRVRLEISTLMRRVRNLPIDRAIYELANYAGRLRATR